MSTKQHADAMVGLGVASARYLAPAGLQREVDAVGARANQTQTVIVGVVIAAALLIGFFVVSSINDAVAVGNRSDSLDEDKNSTVGRIGDGFLIGGVIIIVLMAAVILRTLRGL